MIRWTKGSVLIRAGEDLQKRRAQGHIRSEAAAGGGSEAFVTKKGSLRIRDIGFEDAGVYTCRGARKGGRETQ